MLLIETVFDTLNAKAALFACDEAFAAAGRRVPIMLSGTITDASGRTLSGQTPEAFAISTEHADILSVGLNCALGPAQLRPHLREIAAATQLLVSTHPNAGLPNAFGDYDETPEQVSRVLREYAADGLLNIVGGCCGTTPDHIRLIAEAVAGLPPRVPPRARPTCAWPASSRWSSPTRSRSSTWANAPTSPVAPGSASAIRAADDAAAVAIAAQQVAGGAQLIDVNVDDAMLDGPETMGRLPQPARRWSRTSPGCP